MLALITLGIIWVVQGDPLQQQLSFTAILPSFNIGEWTVLAAIMSSFARMELAGVHIAQVKNSTHTFPRAMFFAGAVILISILLGSLSIALVLPQQTIHLAGGLMQVFSRMFHTFHLEVPIFYVSLMIVVGSLGTLVNWVMSPAKGLLHASQYGYLPTYFTHLNKNKDPSHILLVQAMLVTASCFLLLILPSVNAFYWFLMVLSGGIYMILYILMFLSAIRLRTKMPMPYFRIPFGKVGLFTTCGFGLIGTTLTICVSFIAPPDVPIAEPLTYALMILAGNILLISPVFYLFYWKDKCAKRS